MQKDQKIEEKQQEEQNPAPVVAPVAHRGKTWGVRIHNELTYRGVDWVLNSIVGVGTTYWSQMTKSGQEYFAKPVGKFFENIVKNFSKNPATIATGSRWGSMFVSIIVGGTAIIPLMMGLENKGTKLGIVKWLDEKIYGKEKVSSDPEFAKAYQEIEHEPKKDFWSGMAARFAVLLPMLIGTLNSTSHGFLTKTLYNPISACTKFGAKTLGIQPKSLMTASAGNGKTKWDFIHNTIGFEFGLTIVYSFLHEYAYKGLAGLWNKEKPPASASLAQPDQSLNADNAAPSAHSWAAKQKHPKPKEFTQRVYQDTPAMEMAL